MNMKISKEGIDLIKHFEGFSSKTYRDAVGVCTIGYGMTHWPDGTKVKCTDKPISEELASAMLESIINAGYGEAVNRIGGEMLQGQFDALTSFAYNLGPGALLHSTLLRKHLAGDSQGAAKEFLKWVNAGGRKLSGLVRRRKAERDLYLS